VKGTVQLLVKRGGIGFWGLCIIGESLGSRLQGLEFKVKG
jgi:hypothetical protein